MRKRGRPWHRSNPDAWARIMARTELTRPSRGAAKVIHDALLREVEQCEL